MNPYKQKNIKIKEIKITQRKTLCVVIPECFYQGSTVFENMDSRLKISGMTAGVDFHLNFRHDDWGRWEKKIHDLMYFGCHPTPNYYLF